MSLPVLTGPRVTLRPPRTSDLEPLHAILQEPEVSEWWVGYTPERVRIELIDSDYTNVIEVGGQTAGVVYVIPPADAEYPTTIAHIFLGTSWRGSGIGSEALALAVRHQFAHGTSRVTLDPNAGNLPAIRAYERLGFKRIGILRDYQLRPDGSLDDALFLDITRSDFPDGPALPEVR